MKQASIALGMALLASAATANAEIVTFEYTAAIIDLTEWGPWSPIAYHVESSNLPGFTVSNGETITGRLSYDTSMQLVPNPDFPSGHVYELGSTAKITHTFTLQGSGTSSSVDSSPGVQMEDYSSGADQLTFTGNAGGNNWWETYLSLTATRPGYQPAVLPGAAELGGTSGYTANSFYITFWDAGIQLNADAKISSFHVVSSVPEPSTYAMLLAGAVPLLLRRRKAQA
jgi:hypothetical protein